MFNRKDEQNVWFNCLEQHFVFEEVEIRRCNEQNTQSRIRRFYVLWDLKLYCKLFLAWNMTEKPSKFIGYQICQGAKQAVLQRFLILIFFFFWNWEWNRKKTWYSYQKKNQLKIEEYRNERFALEILNWRENKTNQQCVRQTETIKRCRITNSFFHPNFFFQAFEIIMYYFLLQHFNSILNLVKSPPYKCSFPLSLSWDKNQNTQHQYPQSKVSESLSDISRRSHSKTSTHVRYLKTESSIFFINILLLLALFLVFVLWIHVMFHLISFEMTNN